ncbi:DUF6364 family protein [Methylovulum miyakonense]|uniref:DUF6364 family protein n=1 Tax=Methylovulum miyakonense TaxID=645578 RepID=UPI00036EF56F|nr:DUF6364 family protein [Methylovulum miyakonense]
MHTKLTLDIEDDLIHQVEAYAKTKNKSVSDIVIDYFQELTQQKQANPLLPITQSLLGILQHCEVDETDYKQYLKDKYL